MATPTTPPAGGYVVKTSGWDPVPTVPTTPPAGGYVVKTSGWDPVPTVPTTPPAGGYVVRVGGLHIGSLRLGAQIGRSTF